MKKDYDIVIVGAGVAGLSLAGLLKNTDLSILLLDQQSAPQQINDIDLMQRALTHTSQHVMEEIGVWDQLSAGRYDKMFVWDDAAAICFKARDVGKKHLGHIVSYRDLHFALYEKLKSEKNITFLFEVNPERFLRLGKNNALQVSGEKYTANLVVGADGKNSWLRETLGIACKRHSYFEKALVANVQTELSHQHTAWQRFLPTGPLAFLPFDDQHHASIVWTNPSEETERLLHVDDQAFLAELNTAFENKLGQVTAVSKRAAFPLVLQHAKHYVGDGWALIADAAHVVHPLAGLGLNLGINDVRCLADFIVNAVQQKQSFSSVNLLRRYERTRRTSNQQALWFVDQIHHMFVSKHKWVHCLRDTGLKLINRSTLVKQFFVEQVL